MSAPAAMKPMTRLLIQKQAEPDEYERIAIGALRDAGWTVESIGLEIAVSLTRTAYTLPDAEPEVNIHAVQASLNASRAYVAKLRRDLDRRRGNGWLLAGAVAAGCAALVMWGRGEWCWTIAAACGAISGLYRHRRTKGAS